MLEDKELSCHVAMAKIYKSNNYSKCTRLAIAFVYQKCKCDCRNNILATDVQLDKQSIILR